MPGSRAGSRAPSVVKAPSQAGGASRRSRSQRTPRSARGSRTSTTRTRSSAKTSSSEESEAASEAKSTSLPEEEKLFKQFPGDAAGKQLKKDVKDNLTSYFGVDNWARVYARFTFQLSLLPPNLISGIAAQLLEDTKKGLPAFRVGSDDERMFGDPSHEECGAPYVGQRCMNTKHWVNMVCKCEPVDGRYPGHVADGEHSAICCAANRDPTQLEEYAFKRLPKKPEAEQALPI
jgi:hypothetical protein